MLNQPIRMAATGRKLWSFAACLLAILMGTGGHWYVLQTVAWARMFVDFAQRDSIAVAVGKTFDGQHPCQLCLEIRHGQQKEQPPGGKLPWLQPEKVPELICEVRLVEAPLAPSHWVHASPFTQKPHVDFLDSPPTPPPRTA